MTTETTIDPSADVHLLLLRDLDEDAFEIKWKARHMGDHYAIATSWFEIQELLTRLGSRGWEYLIVEPGHPSNPARWAQCLGRPNAMSIEVAVWNPRLHQVELWRLGRGGLRHPLIDVHPSNRFQEMVRPCQVLTARDAIAAFHDWLVYGRVTGFTREHHIY